MNAGYVENALTFSTWLRLFRYVAKMAAVEYEKCALFWVKPSGSFEYTSFPPIWIGTSYVLKLSSTSTDSTRLEHGTGVKWWVLVFTLLTWVWDPTPTVSELVVVVVVVVVVVRSSITSEQYFLWVLVVKWLESWLKLFWHRFKSQLQQSQSLVWEEKWIT